MRKVRQAKSSFQMYYNPLFLQTPSTQEAVFYETDLGKLYKTIPFQKLALSIRSPRSEQSGRGRKPFLKVEGGIALMILKHYLGLSDELLMERLNTDWCMQYFCGIRLGVRKIKDKNLVSWWRGYLGKNFDIGQIQIILAGHWKPQMSQTHVTLMDATVYESSVRYPTDAKLIWESIVKFHGLLEQKRKRLKLRRSRSNYDKHKKLYLFYQKSRKKGRRKDKKLRKQLLKFMFRLRECLKSLKKKYQFRYSGKEQKLLVTLQKIYKQQHELLYGDTQKVSRRIVSIHKPYVRPIVRGKETKPVEFGLKVHKVQVDGISFIEHMSYEAFNESTRLKQSVAFHQKHFGKLSQLGADRIYATNKNRSYCTKMNIATTFIPKGNEGKLADQKQTMRSVLSKIRATVLEGSFGNEKNNYLLNKVKAKTKHTEKAWVFFGMLAANASIISKRIEEKEKRQRA